MAQIIPEGYVFVARGDRTRREAATELLAAADKAGVDQTLIRVTQGGYLVPEAVAPDSVEEGAPSQSDNKQAWFDYAVSQGHEGEYDDVTKAELIERYGN